MTRRVLQLLCITLVLSTLGGCGFKLRGCFNIPQYLQVVYIPTNNPYDPLQRELRYRLAQNNVKVINHPQKDVTVLEVYGPEISEETIAFGSSQEVQRYKISMTIRYKINIKNGATNIDETHSITRARELSRSNNALLSNESEKQTVKKELLAETVSELLRQLTTLHLNRAPSANATPVANNPC